MKILIVEDDLMIAQQILKDVDQVYRNQLTVVGQARSFDEGIDLLQTDPPDIALLDIQLGHDASAGIRLGGLIKHKSAIPIVYLTGLPDKVGFDKAKHTLPCSFLKKPYDLESFRRAIDLAIAHSQHRSTITSYHPSFLKPLDEHCIWIKTSRSKHEPVLLNEILFVQSDNHNLTIHTSSNPDKVEFYSALSEFFERNLSVFPQFYKLDRSHIINLKKIQKIESNYIYYDRVRTERKIAIPKDSKKELFQRLNLPFHL